MDAASREKSATAGEANRIDAQQVRMESGFGTPRKKRAARSKKSNRGCSAVAVQLPRAATHESDEISLSFKEPATSKEVIDIPATSTASDSLQLAREPSSELKVPTVESQIEQAPTGLQIRPSWEQAEDGPWRVSNVFETHRTTEATQASAAEWMGAKGMTQSLKAEVGGNSREKLTLREALQESTSMHSPATAAASERFKKQRRCLPECLTQFHARLVAVLIGLWIVFGLIALGSEVGENLGLVDALYVMTQVLTTIGYGDLTDWEDDGMKFFLSLYALFGMVVVASVIAVLGKEMQQSSQDLLMHRLLNVRNQEDDDVSAPPVQAPIQVGTRATIMGKLESSLNTKVRQSTVFLWLVRFQGVFTSGLLVLVALLIGTLFYGSWESCSCGRGNGKVPGCDENNCEETGGFQKSYLDAWYMSCISLSTVGFGDFAPVSTLGRCFAIVWMILGVIAVANFQVEVSKILLKNDKVSKILDTDLDELFDIFDKDGNGNLDAHEFLVFALLEGGLVDRATISQIQDLFASLDVDRDGCVSREEIHDRFEQQREEEANDQTWFGGVFNNTGLSHSSLWSKSSTFSEDGREKRNKKFRPSPRPQSPSAPAQPRMSNLTDASSVTSGSILGRPQTPVSPGSMAPENVLGKPLETG